ncbi:MAG: ribonuclease H-like domain-containing protein [Cytophagales bacterium]|nr:ribonuclease H-like domain-containing protein [Armatimonadota bacterium]
MLTATFLHAQGIGDVTERRLWDQGFTSWQSVLAASRKELPLTDAQRTLLLPVLEQSVTALENEDYGYFAGLLPQREHWRAAPALMDRIGFLDIETNGGYRADSITVIGVYDGDESRLYVKDRDLDQFAEDAARYALWVTFFGTGFDLPFLRRRFPDLPLNQLHIDLCPALRRLGYKGGLKRIERQIGIGREEDISGMSGYDAVRLWREWRSRKSQAALDLLLAYNRADIENLSLLLAFAYGRLKAASGFPD